MIALAYPDPPLRDGAIALRRWTETDLPGIVAACQDASIVRFITPITAPYGEADARAWFEAQEPNRLAGSGIDLAIAGADAGELLGAVGLGSVDATHGRAMIGYWVAPEARGRGIASAALRLLADWALTTLGLARLELITDPDNMASQRVALRCGFVREGVLRSHLVNNGARRDSIMHSLLAGEVR